MSNKPKQIIYLAQKYSGREAEALAEAMDYKWKLEAKGFTPENGYAIFSPIINSALEDWCKNPNFIIAMHNIFEGLSPDDTFDPTLVKFMQFIQLMTKIKPNLDFFDYVQYDLILLEEWLHHDALCTKSYQFIKQFSNKLSYWNQLERCDECAEEGCSGRSTECPEFDGNTYDSGVLMTFCPSCFQTYATQWDEEEYDSPFAYTDKKERDYWWNSKGAKAEYDFAKANHVECVLADSLVRGQRERI